MQKHELRNELPPLSEREIELLVYGVFAGFEGDKGYYFTAWVPLGDVLMSISREMVIVKLASFRDGLALALEAACAVPAATTQTSTVPPAAASPVAPVSPATMGPLY
jgi:hypothetical protein